MSMTIGDDFAVEDLLSSDREVARSRLGAILNDRAKAGLLGKVSAWLLTTLSQQLLDMITGRRLRVDLGQILLSGWRSHEALAAAGAATIVEPGSIELVELPSISVTTKYRPSVDVLVNGVVKDVIRFTVTLVVRSEGTIAHVADGRLTWLEMNACTASADLAVDEDSVLSGSTSFGLGTRFSFEGGIELVTAPPSAPADASVPPQAPPAD